MYSIIFATSLDVTSNIVQINVIDFLVVCCILHVRWLTAAAAAAAAAVAAAAAGSGDVLSLVVQ